MGPVVEMRSCMLAAVRNYCQSMMHWRYLCHRNYGTFHSHRHLEYLWCIVSSEYIHNDPMVLVSVYWQANPWDPADTQPVRVTYRKIVYNLRWEDGMITLYTVDGVIFIHAIEWDKTRIHEQTNITPIFVIDTFILVMLCLFETRFRVHA